MTPPVRPDRGGDPRRPGMWLRAFTARLCDAKAMTHLIDPIVADLQHEHAEARRDGAIWRGRWVRLAGGFALIKVLSLHRGERMMEILRGITRNDNVGARAVLYSIFAMTAMTVLLMLPPLQTLSVVDPLLALYMVPQALPLAIPFGLIVGILSAFGGRVVSRREAGRVLLLGAVCSVLTFVILGWLVPSSNYAYRVRVEERYAERTAELVGTPGPFDELEKGEPLWKGPNELTLPEFRRMYLRVTTTEIATGLPRAGWTNLRSLWFMYHVRWTIPWASLVFTLVALSVTRHRRAVRVTVSLAATVFYCCFYFFFTQDAPGPLPPGVLAWLPNILFAGAALAWMAAGRSRPSPGGGFHDPDPGRAARREDAGDAQSRGPQQRGDFVRRAFPAAEEREHV